MQLIIIIILLLLVVVSASLERFYSQTSVNDLKRKRRGGDARASLVYEVVRNITLARYYLNFLTLVSFALLAAYLSQKLSLINATLAILLVIGVWYFARIKNKYVSSLAIKIAPKFAYFIVLTRPYVLTIKKSLSWIMPKASEADGVAYDKTEIIELLNNQKTVKNKQLDNFEIDLAVHALTFGDKKVKEHMTPRKVVRFVRSDEPVSTVLMSELHDSGFSRFPVYMEDKDNIVGTLFLKDLVERRMTGKVFSAMSNEYYEIQENDSLEDALKQFIKTQHHIFIVKNQFSEVVGVITIEDVIEQMIGRKIIDESDAYDDMREHAEEDPGKDQPTVLD